MTDSSFSAGSAADKTWFGHPRGLATLFFTEMWERFSYYGMRALLVLYMAAAIREGGMGLTDEVAAAIYGLYVAGVYLFALPGGWIADRMIGLQNAIWYGGILITLGHFSLAIPTTSTFYIGLVLIVLGTGLLKPNISAIVGDLYPEGGARRDAGFSIFYMGINIGAFIAPLICSYLGENIDWHYGFAAAGIGMLFGVIQYRATRQYLKGIGVRPSVEPRPEQLKRMWMGVALGVGLIALVVGLSLADIIQINAVYLASITGGVILGAAVLYFAYIFMFTGLDAVEKKRVTVIAVLLIFAALFWSGFEQAGSSLNLFAERYTDRVIFGWEMPAGWLQSVNALFIIILAPVFGVLWIQLAKRMLEPSAPIKFALGLIFLGLGFFVIYVAATIVVSGSQVLPTWLVSMYLLHTIGELCLSPVGLSTMTKLAPPQLSGQVMGLWFMATSFGNLIAGLVAGRFDSENIEQIPELFWTVTLVMIGAGVVLLLISRPLRKMMGGVK